MDIHSKTPFGRLMYVIAFVWVAIAYAVMVLLAFMLFVPPVYTAGQLAVLVGVAVFFLVVGTFDAFWWPVLCRNLPEHLWRK